MTRAQEQVKDTPSEKGVRAAWDLAKEAAGSAAAELPGNFVRKMAGCAGSEASVDVPCVPPAGAERDCRAAAAKGAVSPGGTVRVCYAFAPEGTPPRTMSRAAWELTLAAVTKERGIPREELTRAEGAQGKPYFRDHPEICFNISHSGRCIVCALASEPVGVDVQVRTGRDPSKVARRVFDKETYAAYLVAPDREDFFYTGWTRLESRLKRTGEGFSASLDGVSMDGWFSFPDIGEDYYAAVCTSGKHDLVLEELDWACVCGPGPGTPKSKKTAVRQQARPGLKGTGLGVCAEPENAVSKK